MNLPPKILLKLPVSADADLPRLVKDCLRDGVDLFAICGENAKSVEDHVDWLVIEYESSDSRHMVTTTHDNCEEAIEFATQWNGGGELRILEI